MFLCFIILLFVQLISRLLKTWMSRCPEWGCKWWSDWRWIRLQFSDGEEFFGIVYNTDDCFPISNFMISFLDNNSFCKKDMFFKISILLFSFLSKVLFFKVNWKSFESHFSKPFEIDSILLVKIETSRFT